MNKKLCYAIMYKNIVYRLEKKGSSKNGSLKMFFDSTPNTLLVMEKEYTLVKNTKRLTLDNRK